MARTTLYSRSPRRPAPLPGPAVTPESASPAQAAGEAGDRAEASGPPPVAAGRLARARRALRAGIGRHERLLWFTFALLLAALAGWPGWHPEKTRPLTFKQIDAAMRESIAKEPLASATAMATAAIGPSVVRVVGRSGPETDEDESKPEPRGNPGGRPALPPHAEGKAPPPHRRGPPLPQQGSGRSVGTGVVIVDTGMILTNLHVVDGAERIEVTFSDGTKSPAFVVSRQPEHDLAVLQARKIPDDLQAATLRSTQGLAPGEEVVAVGFPFGIGPSASAGIVSGLKREFRTPDGERTLTNLIQFDAAANPGNSGGPLVTLDGHVVGIVTAIMNPEGHSTFIGIGFAVPIENAAAAVGMPPF